MPSNYINTFMFDKNKKIIIGFSGKGLYSFDGSTLTPFPQDDTKKGLMTIPNGVHRKKDGTLLVGYENVGIEKVSRIFQLDNKNWQSLTEEIDLRGVRELVGNEKDEIWIKGYSGLKNEMAYYNGSTWEKYIKEWNGIRIGAISQLTFDRKGQIWMAVNAKGILTLNPEMKLYKKEDTGQSIAFTTCIYEDNNGKM